MCMRISIILLMMVVWTLTLRLERLVCKRDECLCWCLCISHER